MVKNAIIPVWLLCAAGALHGQLVPIKTVPLMATEQFAQTPTLSAGMANLRLAREDSLRDPFLNPARGALLNGRYAITGANLSRVEDALGGFFSIPITFLYSDGKRFGGLHVSAQQLRADRYTPIPDFSASILPPNRRRKNVQNGFASGYWGRRLSDRDVLAGSLSLALLSGLSGQEYLFSVPIDRLAGRSISTTLGWLRKSGSSELDAVLVYRDISLKTELGRGYWPAESDNSTERELTRTLGLFLAGRRQVAEGLRAGLSLTANRTWHPKIINYTLMNIPRDPGDTSAFELGAGLMFTGGGGWSKSGIEILFRPALSRTWAEAERDLTRDDGSILRKGERTVDNRFRIASWVLRLGLEDRKPPFTVQIGLEARLFRYRLEQENHITGRIRSQRETWMEWKPSFSLQYDFPAVRVSYVFGAVFGSGIPGVELVGTTAFTAYSDAGYLIAPSGRLTLRNAVVLIHRLQITRPLR